MSEIENYNKALLLFNKEDFDSAIKLCNDTLQKNPSHFYTWNLLGNIFFKLKEFEQAKQFFATAIELNSNFIEAYFMLGNLLFSSNLYEDSISIWNKALEIDNSHLVLYTNIALSYIKLNNLEKAQDYLNVAINFNNSDNFEDIFICFSEIYKLKSDFISYKSNLLKAIQLNPSNPKTNFDLSYIYFLEKDYKKAYYHFEFRKELIEERDKYNYLPFKNYNFEKLENKSLLIYHEQGFGDNIQFARFLNNIDCKDISYGIQKSLYKLFSYNFPQIDFTKEIKVSDKYDFMLPIMSIPYFFNLYNIPDLPYLKVKKDDILSFRDKMLDPNKLNIGIVWSGSRTSALSKQKDLNLKDFETLFKDNRVFYSLQIENNDELKNYPNIKNLGKNFDDFYDTAVAICALDIVISTDTAVAHLTGALGKKGIILSNKNQLDWRWENSNSKSIWYKSLNIIKYLDINSSINIINKELDEL